MSKVRIGVIGLGNMGSRHAQNLIKNEVPGAVLAAVCDEIPERLEWARKELGDQPALFNSPEELMNYDQLDGIIIAVPHKFHTDLAIKALNKGLHVLVEKPAGVYAKEVREMNAVAAKSDKVFGMMFNQRTNPLYKKLRDLIESGELGEIRRTNWIVTNWYRSQSYYDSGGWRATWAGEGGGVLINQSPHQLDLWQWTIGLMPKRVRAFCYFGKHRNIEVEDEVTAYVEYENGGTGVFITTTGEAPGTNRFEVSGTRGKIVVEDDKLTFSRLRMPEPEFNSTYKGGFGQPECWKCDVPVTGQNLQHVGIMRDWVDAISKGTPLLASGQEGINGVILANAMLLSAWTDNWVDLPMDEDLFYAKLQERIRESGTTKSAGSNKTLDVNNTY